MSRPCGTYREEERLHTGFWSENMRGKRPLGRPRHRLEDNIKIYLQ